MAPIKLTVNGKGDEHRRPERALLSITISSAGTDQKQVSEEVRVAAMDVQRQIKAMCITASEGGLSSGSPVEEWSTGSLETSSYDDVKYDDNGNAASRLKTYRAGLSLKARFRDFDKLSELTTSLSVAKNVSVDEVRWMLLEKTRLALEQKAIESAYAAAYGKALAYARSMDRKTVTPVEVCDNNTSSLGFVTAGRGSHRARRVHNEEFHVYARVARGYEEGGDGEEKVLAYEPEDVSCSSSCDVIYNID